MITLFCGPMFAGKTESLLREMQQTPCKSVLAKPSCDTRDGENVVSSHCGRKANAVSVQTAGDILSIAEGCDVVFIDEVQFFGPAIISVVRQLSDEGKDVFCAGLDMDSNRLPFGAIGDLMAIADRVVKLGAFCGKCGNVARYSKRIVGDSSDRVFIGGADKYEPRCFRCWTK